LIDNRISRHNIRNDNICEDCTKRFGDRFFNKALHKCFYHAKKLPKKMNIRGVSILLQNFIPIVILAFIFLYLGLTSDVFLLLFTEILNPFTIVENPFQLIYKIILYYALYKMLKYMFNAKG